MRERQGKSITWVGVGVTVVGTIYGASKQRESGKLEKSRRERKAKLLREQAVQERASGQHASEEQRRKAEIIMSNAQATVAAGGGGTIDPSIMQLITGLTAEGERAAGTEKYQAETAAQGFESGAIEEVSQGYAAKRAGDIGALSTLLEGGASVYSMYNKYNPDKPKTTG